MPGDLELRGCPNLIIGVSLHLCSGQRLMHPSPADVAAHARRLTSRCSAASITDDICDGTCVCGSQGAAAVLAARHKSCTCTCGG
jgi:hypothetical protein